MIGGLRVDQKKKKKKTEESVLISIKLVGNIINFTTTIKYLFRL